MSVELQCVGTNSRVRVRIAAYISDSGERFDNVYDDSLNCTFPKHIRALGKSFRVPAENVSFRTSANGKSWYMIKARGIQELDVPMPTIIYETASECVVCMEEASSVVFAPCGHLCACTSCSALIETCCICRAAIMQKISK